MTSVGETLRRERLKRNLGLDRISQELKISSRLLEAIEADQYERLPGGVFAKAFVRQYAGLLGLDGDDLSTQVQHALEPPALQISERAKPAVNPIEVPRVEEWRAVGDKGFRVSGSLPAAALVVVVMLVCSGIYAWMQRPRSSPAARTSTPAPAAAAPSPSSIPTAQAASSQPAPPTTPAQPPAADASAAPPQPGSQTQPGATQSAETPANPSAPASAQAPPGPPGPVHVEVVADDTVWVLARVDGKFVFSGTMEANSRRTLDGEKDVLLRLGNAGGVTIFLNGKPVGPAGPKGQVRTVQLTSGGFQIVPPKPAEVPLDPLDR